MSTHVDSIMTHLAGTWDTLLTETVEELRQDLVSLMRVVTKNADHVGWCPVNDGPEEKCDCPLNDLIQIVRGGQ
jgi:hypothetical protein